VNPTDNAALNNSSFISRMTSVYHPASIRNSASGGTTSNKAKSSSAALHTSAGYNSNNNSKNNSNNNNNSGNASPTLASASILRQSAGHLLRPHIEHCGYLMKQGSSTYSTFRKRWFVLTDGKLLYYETRKTTFELGLVDLVNVTAIEAGGDPSVSGNSSNSGNSGGGGGGSVSGGGGGGGGGGSAMMSAATGSGVTSASFSDTAADSHSSSTDSYRFRIETPKRIYQLVAASDAEMWQWISCLRLARLVLQERDMTRDSLRQQIELGRRMRDEQAAAVSMLEAEHAAHTDARHRVVELTERNEQLRDWNDRVTTQLEHTELELARTRQKLRDALVFVRAYEIAQMAGANLVSRLDLREQQVDALRAQLEAMTSVAALPETAVEAAARANALTREIEAQNDELAASQTMILSTTDVGLSEASIRELREELKRRDELPVVAPPAELDSVGSLASAASVADSAAAVAAGAGARHAERKRQVWVPAEAVDDCSGCHSRFSLLRWKKRCSGCGGVYCNDCLPNQVTMRFQNEFKTVRVCNECYTRAKQAHESRSKERAAVNNRDD
jgi:hypothetical protein